MSTGVEGREGWGKVERERARASLRERRGDAGWYSTGEEATWFRKRSARLALEKSNSGPGCKPAALSSISHLRNKAHGNTMLVHPAMYVRLKPPNMTVTMPPAAKLAQKANNRQLKVNTVNPGLEVSAEEKERLLWRSERLGEAEPEAAAVAAWMGLLNDGVAG